MQYEKTPVKQSKSKDIVKKVENNNLNHIATGSMLWHLVKRHKFVLVTVYAIVISILYFIPFSGDMVRATILGL